MTDRPRIDVVGLGPSGPDLVTAGTVARIAEHAHRYLRTERHPAASVVADAITFDDVYETADVVDEVYPTIVERLVVDATEHGAILYAVPGSPVVAERTVELLREDPRVEVRIEPALSFLDLAWARLGIDPIALGVRVVDGQRFETEAAGERGPLLVAQCDSVDVLSAVKLAIGDALETRSQLGGALASDQPGALADDLEVTVLHHLGAPTETIRTVRWDDLDREVDADHLTSLYLPAHAAPVAYEVQRFAELVATLRRECPWDREQTHASLRRHLVEEAYEVVDALDHLDVEAGTGFDHLAEELGDLLFQVVFHATIATEEGQFTLADVARGVHDKLYLRHPHVFGSVEADSAGAVEANWEAIKKAEKGRASVFDGIPDALPALLYALKVQKKAASLDLDGLAPLPSIEEATAALDAARASGDDGEVDAAVGALLLAVVDRARVAGVDPEMALRAAVVTHRDEARAREAAAEPRS
jgi:tetrapyrrole methylase family protein/MazG family protein